LLPFSLFYVLLRGWYSLEDTRTPFFLTVLYNVLMVAISLPLFAAAPVEFKVLSLALGYAAAYWLTLGVAWFVLGRRLPAMPNRRTAWVLVRLLLAGLVAAGVGLAVNAAVTGLAASVRGQEVDLGFVGLPGWALMAAVVCCAAAVAVYALLAWLLRVPDVAAAWDMVAGKVPGLRSRRRARQ
jgi:putative peptidoglycan lipid II flippase